MLALATIFKLNNRTAIPPSCPFPFPGPTFHSTLHSSYNLYFYSPVPLPNQLCIYFFIATFTVQFNSQKFLHSTTFWASRGHRSLPLSPLAHAFAFVEHSLRYSHYSLIFIELLLHTPYTMPPLVDCLSLSPLLLLVQTYWLPCSGFLSVPFPLLSVA